MNMAERHAWHAFRETMAKRQNEFDGQVPVVLLCLAVCHGGEACHGVQEPGSVDVHKNGSISLLRPPGMTLEELAGVLTRAAEELREGTLR